MGSNVTFRLLDPVSRRVAVIGAGPAGLTLARFLTEAGVAVTVFEMEPGPGGRLCTSHQEGGTFDYGIQYFTARAPGFQRMVRTWVEQGHAAVWRGRFGSLRDGTVTPELSGPERYVGTPCMSSVARQLASRVEVHYGVWVKSLRWEFDGTWLLTSAEGHDLGPFDAVAVAVPAPQAVLLLDMTTRAVHHAHMEPCWAVMADFDEPVPLPLDGVFIHDSQLSWAARDNSKPGRPPGERWVLHATSKFTWEYLEDSPWFVASLLVEAFARVSRLELRPRMAVAYRWLYARPSPALNVGSLFDVRRGLGLCGDWCAGSRVEGSIRSGMALARQLAMFLSER